MWYWETGITLRWIPFKRHVCVFISLTTAGSRLRKDRLSSPGEPRAPEATRAEFQIYEEVTQYMPRPGERPRLIVLIGGFCYVWGNPSACILSLSRWLCSRPFCFLCCRSGSQVLWELGSLSSNRRWSLKTLNFMVWLCLVSLVFNSHKVCNALFSCHKSWINTKCKN